MKRVLNLLLASVIFQSATLQSVLAASSAVVPDTSVPNAKLSPREMEDLAAPIALYPDPLLGLILPASVFPDQVVDAALLIKTKADAELISKQDWDASVKGIATYPGVLKMMYEKIDWTTKLGNAFLNQSPELRDAIQTLRLKAQSVGNLKSTEQQTVSTKNVNGDTVVVIEPTQPQVVYVPQDIIKVVYSEPAPSSSNYLVPLATFGLGMALGSAMNDDDDINVYGYGGYPGRVAWYDNNSVEHWADNRQDMIRDSQQFHQDRAESRQDFRQDRGGSRQDFRQDQIESGNWNKDTAQQRRDQVQSQRQGGANTAANQARADQARQNRASMNSSQSQAAEQRKQQAQQRSQDWKSQSSDRGYSSGSRGSGSGAADSARTSRASSSSGSRSSSAGSSAFGGSSSRSSTSAYSSRGSSSRSAGGYSRSGGGGGGGGRRGGGGGGGRRR